MVIKIIGDDVLELGVSAGANIAGDTVAIFVHNEENIGAIEIFPKALISTNEAFGIGVVIFC